MSIPKSGDRDDAYLQGMIRQKLDLLEKKAEITAAVMQLIIFICYGCLYLLAPKSHDNTTALQPVLIALSVAIPVGLMRLFLAAKDQGGSLRTYAFIVFDVLLVLGLILSFHWQYQQGPYISLKAPTFVLLFIIVGIRGLSLNPRYVLTAGAMSVLGWVALTGFAVADWRTEITRSFIAYAGSNAILIGAEVEKIISLLLFSGVVYIAVQRNRVLYTDITTEVEISALELDKRRKQEIQFANERENLAVAAREAEVQKVRFMSLASHELRTPMNGVIGNLELLSEMDDLANSSLFQSARDAASQLADMINRVIDFTELQDLTASPRNVHLKTFLESIAVSQEKNETDQKAFRFEISADLDREFRFDPKLLRNGLEILLENAFKFTELGVVTMRVDLRGANGNSTLVAHIADTGTGIDPVYVERAFKPFTQEDTGLSRSFGGAGLGLSTCRSIAEKLGGKVYLRETHRTVGRSGSVFTFEIPLEPPFVEEHTAPQQVARAKMPLGEAKVLVVEDNPINLKVLVIMLRSLGLSADTAENGELAVELCNNEKYDLILMDIQMPVMDGNEATERIRKLPAFESAVIIAVTAHATGENFLEKCRSYGFDDLIEKPLKKGLLVEHLQGWFTEVPVPTS